ncbi:hypothetical protein [Nocardiopsis potens]|uniref:hypothetical protein n=1 Tax=Nocardiopsis potens TaxID=1246458 RepID=UPI00034CED6C|nr:hypothetical protein [Nocardiopsis potens]
MAILLIIGGLVLTGLAAGFLLAVSFGDRQHGRERGHRSLREDDEGGAPRSGGRAAGTGAGRDRRLRV